MRIRRDEPVIILEVVVVGKGVGGRGRHGAGHRRYLHHDPVGPGRAAWYDPTMSTRRVNLVTASTTEKAPLITLEAIEVLGVRLADVDVACHDLPPTSRVQGLIGLSFLKETNLAIRFKEEV